MRKLLWYAIYPALLLWILLGYRLWMHARGARNSVPRPVLLPWFLASGSAILFLVSIAYANLIHVGRNL